MSSRLAIDEQHELREINTSELSSQSKSLRIMAKIISYIFHPVFIPVYVAWFLINFQSQLFAEFTVRKKTDTMITFFVMYVFFPLISTLLLKGLGFINTIYLKTQRDRIIPYIVNMIYYFWVWWVLYNQTIYSSVIVMFALAIFIASFGGLMANIYMKVSMHAIAVGVMATYIILLGFLLKKDFGIYISVALLITGLVCTARLIASDHSQKEIYWGLVIGIASQIVASWFN
jgi:hypothetical protein